MSLQLNTSLTLHDVTAVFLNVKIKKQNYNLHDHFIEQTFCECFHHVTCENVFFSSSFFIDKTILTNNMHLYTIRGGSKRERLHASDFYTAFILQCLNRMQIDALRPIEGAQ